MNNCVFCDSQIMTRNVHLYALIAAVPIAPSSAGDHHHHTTPAHKKRIYLLLSRAVERARENVVGAQGE